jgi:hypothetical protein
MVAMTNSIQKKGRTQKCRLTLLNGATGRPIAEELSNSKDPETIEAFFARYLDPTKRTFIVTYLYPSYPGVFEEFFGDHLVHQCCLLHLNKLIVGDFPKKTTIEQELMQYRLLNIFYNRNAEIEILKGMAEEEQAMKQLRTDRGIENQMKLSAMKRAGLLSGCKKIVFLSLKRLFFVVRYRFVVAY